MYRKDLIETEIQKLTKVIDRILGLKNDGDVDQAIDLSYETLEESFGLSEDFLESGSTEDFEVILLQKKYAADKLNLLAQLMFESVYPFNETEETIQVLHKTALILNQLETEYHQQSLENLHRRDMIDKFLSNRQYE